MASVYTAQGVNTHDALHAFKARLRTEKKECNSCRKVKTNTDFREG